MKSGAEAAPRGTTGRRPELPAPEVTGEREEGGGATMAAWPSRAGNQAVGQFVSTRAGHALPPVARAVLEQKLGASFEDVRIHTGPEAQSLADGLDARAFTVGRDVVFGAGEYQPNSEAGLRLLAHELTHVTQQRLGPPSDATGGPRLIPASHESERESRGAERSFATERTSSATSARGDTRAGSAKGAPARRLSSVSGPAIQRQPRGGPVAEFDVGNEFTRRELVDYLDALDARGTIEDHLDSDDKARAIVKQWADGGSPFVVSARRAMLMIKEMQDGFTGDDDERAILELLWRARSDDLLEMFGPGGLEVKSLNSDFQGDEWNWLRQFYDERLPEARRKPPEIKPRGEPVALGTPIPVYASRATPTQAPVPDADPSAPRGDLMHPERCATYEEWISFFTALPTYRSATGHTVFGPAPAPAATATDLTAPLGSRRPPVVEPRERYLPTDRFIDGPTEQWVRANLPPNLVETAYQLPSDCADIAVVLRHVWLAAHNREEMYHGWLCGSRLGDPRSRDMNQLLLNEVYSGNVAGIVSAYSDAAGARIRTFGALEPLLHPGDILVWSHPGGGGHTHTIMSVTRDAQGHITSLQGLQGNQPIGRDSAARMVSADSAAQARRPKAQRQGMPTEDDLRKAPGRRIELGQIPFQTAARNPDRVWNWGEGTTLVAAGPAAAAPRPRAPRGQQRALANWVPAIQAATLDSLDSTLESALGEIRTFLELGTPPALADVQALGQTAGARLLIIARDAGDVQQGGTHYARVQRMAAQVRWYGGHVNRNNVPAMWTQLEETFVAAARGISTVDFSRTPAAGRRHVNVLVSGFDPFNTSDIRQPPRPGDWNPSAAAARQLDGETINVDADAAAAVEGVVFPVSFREFRAGIVERVIAAHPNVNAVITVSLDANLDPSGPVDLEQYAVGVHRLGSGQRERVPGVAGGSAGPLVEEGSYDLGPLSQEVGQGGTPTDTNAQRPTVDYTLTLEFADATTADAALAALGETAQRSDTVDIKSESAVRAIMGSMRREIGAEGMRITFAAGGHTFGAELLSGPGGNFLSNEVSYRALRQLQERAQAGGPAGASFHVHTPGAVQSTGEALPPAGTDTASRQQRTDAESRARTVLTRLLTTLRRVIAAVARRIVRPTGAPRP